MMDCKRCPADDFGQQAHYATFEFGFLLWAIIADECRSIMAIIGGTKRYRNRN